MSKFKILFSLLLLSCVAFVAACGGDSQRNTTTIEDPAPVAEAPPFEEVLPKSLQKWEAATSASVDAEFTFSLTGSGELESISGKNFFASFSGDLASNDNQLASDDKVYGQVEFGFDDNSLLIDVLRENNKTYVKYNDKWALTADDSKTQAPSAEEDLPTEEELQEFLNVLQVADVEVTGTVEEEDAEEYYSYTFEANEDTLRSLIELGNQEAAPGDQVTEEEINLALKVLSPETLQFETSFYEDASLRGMDLQIDVNQETLQSILESESGNYSEAELEAAHQLESMQLDFDLSFSNWNKAPVEETAPSASELVPEEELTNELGQDALELLQELNLAPSLSVSGSVTS